MKRAARKLLEDSPERFDGAFQKNKDVLREIDVSPKLRNQIAGFITSTINKTRKRNARNSARDDRLDVAAQEEPAVPASEKTANA